MKYTISELNVSLNEIYGTLDTTGKKKITELENTSGESIQNGEEENMRLKNKGKELQLFEG